MELAIHHSLAALLADYDAALVRTAAQRDAYRSCLRAALDQMHAARQERQRLRNELAGYRHERRRRLRVLRAYRAARARKVIQC